MPSDLPPLLLLATPALLDGWCGPVVDRVGEPGVVLHARGGRPVLVRPDGLGADIDYGGPGSGWAGLPPLWVDLARAEIRDRVARVVCGTPLAWLRGWPDGQRWMVAESAHGKRWWASHADRFLARLTGEEQLRPECLGVVPALADLDPNDPRRLPDGSRWVDAAALLAVARRTLHPEEDP